jgi:hypothetical protein
MMHLSKIKSDLGKGAAWADRDAEDEFSEYRPPPEAHVSELKRLERNLGIQVTTYRRFPRYSNIFSSGHSSSY